jgi:4-amino-4-deoxy-L-arabinose transferase-like glycosyltransferase
MTGSKPQESLFHSHLSVSDGTKVIMAILAMVVVRCIAAISFPLLGTEAYYWLWGQFPAFGYYNHPPMVAWISAAFFGWVKMSQLAARSGPIVLGALTTWVLYLLARDLFPGKKTAMRVAILFGLVPIFDAGCILLEPDCCLAFFMALTWLLFWRAARGTDRLVPWLAVGLAAGLALLSKYQAWGYLPPLYLFLFLSPTHRRWLRTPGPWLAIGIALLVASPNALWNYHHHWISYRFLVHRSQVDQPGFQLADPAMYFLGPLVTLSPLVYVAVLVGIWRGARRWFADRSPAVLYLLVAGVPVLTVFGAASFLTPIAQHWAAIGFAPLFVLALGLIEDGRLGGPRFRKAMWATCIAFTVILHSLPLLVRVLPNDLRSPFQGSKANVGRLEGGFADWYGAGSRIRDLHAAANAHHPTMILTPDFHLAAILAFYSGLTDQFATYKPRQAHQFALWRPATPEMQGRDALVAITFQRTGDSPNMPEGDVRKATDLLSQMFRTCELGPVLDLRPEWDVPETGVGHQDPGMRGIQILQVHDLNVAGWQAVSLSDPLLDN